jgi:hypothetical protein
MPLESNLTIWKWKFFILIKIVGKFHLRDDGKYPQLTIQYNVKWVAFAFIPQR